MSTRPSHLSILSDILMIILALISGFFLLITEFGNPTFEQIAYFEAGDMIIAYIFLIDFFVLLYISSDRKKFVKTRWWEVLAAIPITTESTQLLRLLRLLRIARVIRIGMHIEMVRRDVVEMNEKK